MKQVQYVYIKHQKLMDKGYKIALNHQHGIHQVLRGSTQVELASGQRQDYTGGVKPMMFPALRTRGGSLHHVSLTAVLFTRMSTPCCLLRAGRTNSASIKLRVQ